LATTGRPLAIASTSTLPSSSYCDGSTKASACCRYAGTARCGTRPTRCTGRGPGEAATGALDLGPQRPVADDHEVHVVGQQRVRRDRVERALLRREPAGEQHPPPRGQLRQRVVVRTLEQGRVVARGQHVDARRVEALREQAWRRGSVSTRTASARLSARRSTAGPSSAERAASPGLHGVPDAAVHRDHERRAGPARDGLGERQHGQVLTLVGVHQARRPGRRRARGPRRAPTACRATATGTPVRTTVAPAPSGARERGAPIRESGRSA
jgi:hypothetical protein